MFVLLLESYSFHFHIEQEYLKCLSQIFKNQIVLYGFEKLYQNELIPLIAFSIDFELHV